MNLGQLVTAVRTQAGIDVDDATAKLWINERYQTMVARARWRMVELAIAVTVVDQARYPLSDDVVDVESILVGEMPYESVGANQLYRIKAGLLLTKPGRGVFGPAYDATGIEQLDLYPAPDTAGDAITALAAMKPSDLVDDVDEPQIPIDLHTYLRDGVIATGLALEDERLSEADRFEARFEDGIDKLTKRKNTRLSAGPVQIQVAGIHF